MTSAADFPIQNLPYGVFRCAGGRSHIGVAIGDNIFDLAAARAHGLLARLPVETQEACAQSSLNALMALGRDYWTVLRQRLTDLLRDTRRLQPELLVPMAAAEMLLPAEIGGYTDFYASVFHATNVGRLFRPDNPLLPNYKYVPIAYNGRASSIVISGTPVRRPCGQLQVDPNPAPGFGPSRALDYEIEVGFFIGPGNRLGEPVPIENAADHIFGLCLVNDWSARDIQKWEYQPLGPFLAKSFATTLSPWIVPAEALEPFRVPALTRPQGDPPPLPYLDAGVDRERGSLDLWLEVFLQTARMREQNLAPVRVSRANFRDMYWTPAQMVAHHTSNGCNLLPGDLLASGTVSGPEKQSRGCLLELTNGGAEPVELPSGEKRTFLQDGDEVIFRGYCERDDIRIGFGECRGRIILTSDF